MQSYTAVVDACAKAGDAARAEHWLAEMHARRCAANIRSYNALLSACAKVGNIARAEYWLTEMMQIRSIDVDVISYNAVIHACAKACDGARAEHWLAFICAFKPKSVIINIKTTNTKKE